MKSCEQWRPHRGRQAQALTRAATWMLLVATLAGCGRVSLPAATPVPTVAATVLPTNTPVPIVPTVTPTTAVATQTPTDTPAVEPTASPTISSTGVVTTAIISGTSGITATQTFSGTGGPRPLDSTFNILLLGSDQRPGEGSWRTDSIMVAAVDWQKERVGLVSIPRDLWVDIPEYGKSRINMADFVGEYEVKYPGGGPALLEKVISDTLDIPIQRYVRMNLTAFEKAIDALGGVTVTLECPMRDATPDPHDPNKLVEVYFAAGPHHFDGHQARLYASYRYYSGDWDRARRQQQVLLAIREQALKFDVIPKIPQLWLAFSKSIQTNLSFKEIVDLVTFGLRLDLNNVHGRVIDYRLVTPYTTKAGAAVLLPKKDEIRQAIDGLFDTPPLQETSAKPVAGCPAPAKATAVPATPAVPAAPITPTLTVTATVAP